MWVPDYERLLDQFDAADQRRGRRYADAGQVRIEKRQTDTSSWRVDAAVRGSMRDPYRVTLRLHPDAAEPKLEGHCSCPRRSGCKHAAAVIYALHDEQLQQRTEPAPTPEVERLSLRLHLADGRPWVQPLLQIDKANGSQRLLEINPAYLRGAEQPQSSFITLLQRLPQLRKDKDHGFALEGADGARLLSHAMDLKLLLDENDQVLQPLPEIAAHWRWQFVAEGEMRPVLHLGIEAQLCWVQGPWAWLTNQGGLASVNSGLEPATAMALQQLEALPVEQWKRAWEGLAPVLGDDFPPPPLPPVDLHERADPTPVLILRLAGARDSQLSRRRVQRVGVVRVGFCYGGTEVAPHEARNEIRTLADAEGGVVQAADADNVKDLRVQRWRRNRGAEKRRIEQLQETGVRRQNLRSLGIDELDSNEFVINSDLDDESLERFCLVTVTSLRELGWQVRYDVGFPLKLMDQDFRLRTEVRAQDGGFSLTLAAQLGGEAVDLWPALREAQLQPLPQRDAETVALNLADGRRVPISVGRLRPLLALIEETGEPPADGGKPDTPTTGSNLALPLPLSRLPLLQELSRHGEAEDLNWVASASLEQLSAVLADALPVPKVAVPKGLKTTLRPYQREGLSWLGFLGLHGLGGVLADDMGLGKTVQLLAHVLAERAAGRMKGPVLVVAPKSVLPNWRQEAQRFVPQLRVVAIEGPQRKRLFATTAREADLLLTTYPLLSRDTAYWQQIPLALAVFDESQLVKNPSTQAARAARALPAARRLALTGTPLENHLGELWAQFDLVLPGLLGPRRRFDKGLRQAIEKNADEAARNLLRQRIAPFLLRRTKDQVIDDLPPKTIVTRAIALEGKQQELYSNRATRLAEELTTMANEGGWQRQRLRVLEGLLRLRQICCDPRLLGDESGHNRPSAKLEYLLNMLGELCAEGRRILVFSQFTSMLGLIAEALNKQKLPYLMLTGDTEDRERPVRRFQAREVPIFLISLRAGGFGLNLTAADTVIHYDPWWNPAVEAQATDRAHRIGQDKPVFVYRLIAGNTIEERILALQERKRELADAIFDAQGQSMANLAVEDLLDLIQGDVAEG